MEEKQVESEKLGKIWKKDKLNSEKIWKIWKKGKLNSDMIWIIWKKSKVKNCFNPSQASTWFSNVICPGLYCIQ